MLGENWFVSETDKRKEESLSDALGISRLTARVLVARGYDTPDSARSFLNKSDLKLHDPMLLKDMDKACERIRKAIDENQSVCIYGDYDVDGVTSTTALYLYLTGRGARCRCFIPERLSEGYGLNKAAIGDIARDTDLIITVDTGITARDEIEYARSLGVDVIVTAQSSNERRTKPAPAYPLTERPFRTLPPPGAGSLAPTRLPSTS